MDVFQLRDDLINDYRTYVQSFIAIRDDRIRERVDDWFDRGVFWPQPIIGLNPTFAPGARIDDLVADGTLHSYCSRIFRKGKSKDNPSGEPIRLHRHQLDAIRQAKAGANYVLTTGTGSGKSMAYIIPIVDHVLREGSGKGVKAIIVYPMNALANSQEEELGKFLHSGLDGQPPVRFARYTGQEDDETRQAILADPPDIILTNYVMLELILTRVYDRELVQAAKGLRFLVLDELHTYRGRQGSDVALLVRRVRDACQATDLQHVGTSATLGTEGTLAEQQAEIARVASLIFGARVNADNVVGETLERVTEALDTTDPAELDALRDAIKSGTPSDSFETFRSDPLASWIESTLGVTTQEGRLIRVQPRSILGKSGTAAELADLVGLDVAECADAIQQRLFEGFRIANPDTGFPVFAFRLHQFISKGETVFASLERPPVRHLTLTGQRFVPEDREHLLYPLAFCRECGQDYYLVDRVTDESTSRFEPRELREVSKDDDVLSGFIYLNDDNPWPGNATEILDRLPADWIESDGERVKSNFRKYLPADLAVRGDGTIADVGMRAVFVPAPFRFCLNCGVSYRGRMSDFAKLGTLGSEGRSTATTLLSLSAIRHLRASDLALEARKLLSFTDNRQDASLQAGHFNDFVKVSQLRAALYSAVAHAGEQGLAHDELTDKVFEALGLDFEEFSVDPDVRFQARTDTIATLKDVLGYFLYLDLRRGWRVTSPNLEQCGLLEIRYPSLDEVCQAEDLWENAHEALARATPDQRIAIAKALLDHLRRELAIKVDYLDENVQGRIRARSGQRLFGMWALDESETMIHATLVLPRARQPKDYGGWTFLSPRSGFGNFLRRPPTFPGYDQHLGLADTEEMIPQIFEALRMGGLVQMVSEAKKPGEVPTYQIPASAMRWTAGDATKAYYDPIRMASVAEEGLRPNEFFVDVYQTLAQQLAGLEAREHTAQVPYEEREEREQRFRAGRLPVLFCSPTMELGIDIAELNVVNLRNVPPTPANYAQRSGRAGRSGQPALVFTYCSTGSSHDQYFFRRPDAMVSGKVSPPRLDLANEDLVRSHVQAVWLSHSGLDLGKSLRDILDLPPGEAPRFIERISEAISDTGTRSRAQAAAGRVLNDLQEGLHAAPWWSERWLDDVLTNIPQAFRAACQRWIDLYESSRTAADRYTAIIQDASRTRPDRDRADRLRREAETQLRILFAETATAFQSDFYSYRYFASEGFLPGYSFPRLPLSAFIPGRRRPGGDGQFISRPRFLAISEFGPRSIIYHEGALFQITRVILPVSERGSVEEDTFVTGSIKRCAVCGYVHELGPAANQDRCENCDSLLQTPMTGMFRLQNVATRRRQRINSDEEERRRQGFEIHTGIRFAQRSGRLSIIQATASAGETAVWDLKYGDTADIWRINVGERRRSDPHKHGFLLDVERGQWARSQDEETEDPEDETGPRLERVIPYVQDHRNCLLLQPREELEPSHMASLMAALKLGIQAEFQLEDDELAAEPLPDTSRRSLLLFYEASEGGAGALRRLVDEPGALAGVARRALQILHFDPDTGENLFWPPGAEQEDRCEAACYDCLLSYRNQLDHPFLDRQLIRDELRQLMTAVVVTTPTSPEVRATTDLEKRFIDFLKEHRLRLPDRAQTLIGDAGTRPDFIYTDAFAAVYVDGPHHRYPDRARRDADQTRNLRDLGYTVIRFGAEDDWVEIAARYPHVFGAGV